MMAGTMELIATATISANQATVTFSSIANNYTDLRLLSSARTDRGNTGDSIWMYFNGDTSSGNYSNRILYGTGGSAVAITAADAILLTQGACGASDTANTFGNSEAYISNYAGSTNKSVSHSGNSERDATTSYMSIDAGLWSNTAAITSITLRPGNGTNFVAGSTFYLYGIQSASATPGKFMSATGGIETISGGYKYHTFTSSGTFFVSEPGYAEYLVVAGGGGGAADRGGGGGAGGLFGGVNFLSSGPFSVIVGAGGTGGPGNGNNPGTSGSGSFFNSRATVGGGRGAAGSGGAAESGGSGGGGASADSAGGVGGAGTSGQGFAGGSCSAAGPAGGGGAGAVGQSRTSTPLSGNGGVGSSAYSTWGIATGQGELSGGIRYFAGGGGGGQQNDGAGGAPGTGGLGGGGAGSSNGGTTPGTSGTANTGGGGGGGANLPRTYGGGAGGSGIVIIRYPVN